MKELFNNKKFSDIIYRMAEKGKIPFKIISSATKLKRFLFKNPPLMMTIMNNLVVLSEETQYIKENRGMDSILNRINLILNETNSDEVSEKQDEYAIFFKKKLKEYGVKSPDQLSKKDKKKFFDEVEKEWVKEK